MTSPLTDSNKNAIWAHQIWSVKMESKAPIERIGHLAAKVAKDVTM